MKTFHLLLVTLVASAMNTAYSASVRGHEMHEAGSADPQEEMMMMICKEEDDMFALTGGACYKDTNTTENHNRRDLKVATSYSVLFYGSSAGYLDNRAQIQLSGSSGTVAWIRFKDEGQRWEGDYEQGGIIRMHMPSHMFPNIIEMLKEAGGINIYMAQGRAFLGIT